MRPKNSINLTNLRINDKFYATNSFGVSSSSIVSGTYESNFAYNETNMYVPINIPAGADLLLFETYVYDNDNNGYYKVANGSVSNITTTPVIFITENYYNTNIMVPPSIDPSSTSNTIVLKLSKLVPYLVMTCFTKYSVIKLV